MKELAAKKAEEEKQQAIEEHKEKVLNCLKDARGALATAEATNTEAEEAATPLLTVEELSVADAEGHIHGVKMERGAGGPPHSCAVVSWARDWRNLTG